jgi:hypothetical protein
VPLDPASLDTENPRTLDGRIYPDHLMAYHGLDRPLLILAMELGTFAVPDLEARVSDPKLRAAIPRWMASATWRGILERDPAGGRGTHRVDMARANRWLAAGTAPAKG